MPLINYGPTPTPKSRKPLKLILGVCATITAVVLGTTFAANINLNTGHPIEFGQGIAATVSCQSNSLTLTPFSSFNNSSNTFVLSELKITDIDSSCADHFFKVAIWPALGSAPFVDFTVGYDNGWLTGNSTWKDSNSDNISSQGGNRPDSVDIGVIYNHNFDQSNDDNIPAMAISKITIESFATKPTLGGELTSLCQFGGSCALGDTGPGGGQIIEVASPAQSWGTYLEAAPTDVPIGIDYRVNTGPDFPDAITAAYEYRGGGLSDWRPPTTNELVLLGTLTQASTPTNTLSWLWNKPLDDTWYWSGSCSDGGPTIICPPQFYGSSAMDFLWPTSAASISYWTGYPSARSVETILLGTVGGGAALVRPVRTFGPKS